MYFASSPALSDVAMILTALGAYLAKISRVTLTSMWTSVALRPSAHHFFRKLCDFRYFARISPAYDAAVTLHAGHRPRDQPGRAVCRADAHGEGKDTLDGQGSHHGEEDNRCCEIVGGGGGERPGCLDFSGTASE